MTEFSPEEIKTEIADLYSTDPRDQYFVQFLPLVINRANRFVRRNYDLHDHCVNSSKSQ